jgi:hypothetical protein
MLATPQSTHSGLIQALCQTEEHVLLFMLPSCADPPVQLLQLPRDVLLDAPAQQLAPHRGCLPRLPSPDSTIMHTQEQLQAQRL